MTIITIPTSPVQSNPDTTIIEKTVASARKYLPGCPIVITFDCPVEGFGSNPAYNEFIANVIDRVKPNGYVIHQEHMHQSGMMKHFLEKFKGDQIVYLEHDWEFTGEIPFDKMIQIIEEGKADLIRVLWPTELPPYYMDKMVGEPEIINGIRLIKTFQWSQNPHIASKEFYKRIMAQMPDGKFIEEGIIADVEADYRLNGWGNYKTFIYVPEGNTQRALHLDGRGYHN